MDNIIKFRAKRLTNRKRGAWAYGHFLPLIEFDLVSDSIEILGNIYDNPELLTNGKNSKAKRNQ